VMKKNELIKYALKAEESKIKLEGKDNECYLYLPTPILELNNMFGPEIKGKYAKINAKNFFIQKRKCLIERNSLDYALFYSLLRELREVRDGWMNGDKKDNNIAPSIENGGIEEFAAQTKKLDSDGLSRGNCPIEQSNLNTTSRKSRTSRKKAAFIKSWYGNSRKKQGKKLFMIDIADPLIVISVLIETKHFASFVYMEKDAININGLKLNKNTNWHKLFHFLLPRAGSNGIRNVLNLYDEKLSVMLYVQNKNKDDILRHMIFCNLDLARKIVLFYNNIGKEICELYVTECEKKENKEWVIEYLNNSLIGSIGPNLLHLYTKYEKEINLTKIAEIKDYIDIAKKEEHLKNNDVIKQYEEVYSFFMSTEGMTSNEFRVKEVLSLELDEEVASETKKMLCRLVKSNVEFIANELSKQNTKSRRTVMRQIVTESWEHMLCMYADLVCTQDGLNRFIFECELFVYIVEANSGTMPADTNERAELERKNAIKMRKAAKFIDVLEFKNPSKSILLNMLRTYLERCLQRKRYGIIGVLRAYLNKRSDFEYKLLQNFRNCIFRMSGVRLKQKIALVDLYYELIEENNRKQRDMSINFEEIMTMSTGNPLNYGRLTPLEIKHVKFGPDVIKYIESFRGKVFERFFDAKNFILFTNCFLSNLTDLGWIENSLLSIKSTREDLNVMVESLISQVKVRRCMLGDVIAVSDNKEVKNGSIPVNDVERLKTAENEEKETTRNDEMRKQPTLPAEDAKQTGVAVQEKEEGTDISRITEQNDMRKTSESSSAYQSRYCDQKNVPKNYGEYMEKEIEPGEIVCDKKRICENNYERGRNADYHYDASFQYDDRTDSINREYHRNGDDRGIDRQASGWNEERIERDTSRNVSYMHRKDEWRENGTSRYLDRMKEYYDASPRGYESRNDSCRDSGYEVNHRASSHRTENERKKYLDSSSLSHRRGNYRSSYLSCNEYGREPCSNNSWNAQNQMKHSQRKQESSHRSRRIDDELGRDEHDDRERSSNDQMYDGRMHDRDRMEHPEYNDDTRNYNRRSGYSWSRYGRRDQDRPSDAYLNERARRRRRQ
ncbi:hypothetical protein THOM_1666, partial [Trachipleistophora hominis]